MAGHARTQLGEYRFALCVFAAAWAVLAFPWLSGAVTIPYDAKALFQAQLQFLANAFHSGQSPFWNPSTFVGVPQISDPQSLLFSPAVLLAYFEKVPSFWQLDAFVLALLGLGGVAILNFCQDKRWHPPRGIVAAIAFAFGASAAWRIQHIAQIQSLVFFAVTLWLLGARLDRSSALCGALAGLAAGLMMLEPNQVAFLGCYVLLGLLAEPLSSRRRPGARPCAGACVSVVPCGAVAAVRRRAAAHLDLPVPRSLQSTRDRIERGGPRVAASGLAADSRRLGPVRRVRSQPSPTGVPTAKRGTRTNSRCPRT